jgi:hypothetical protein
MTIRAEADFIFNVRAKKGERRAAGGRLLKASVFNACDTVASAMAEVAAHKEVMDGVECVEVRYYDEQAFFAWVKNGGDMPTPLHVTKG